MAVSLNDIKKTQVKTTVSDSPETSTWRNTLNIELGPGKLSDSFKESFYSEMALLLEAGMNIKSALDLMAGQQKKEKHTKLLIDVTEKLVKGGRFSEVLQAQRNKFSPYEYFSVKIGEETGNLIEVLKRLAFFYNQRIKQRRALIGALTYPGIIFLTAIGAVTFMLVYMVPMFKDVFGRMGGEMPMLTQMIISLSENFSQGLVYVFIFIFLTAGIHIYYRSNPTYLRLRYSLLIKIPVIGSMMLHTYLLRFVQSMSLLVNSKVPLTEALELSEKMVRFYPISHSLEKIRLMILEGKNLNEGLSYFPIYDKRFISLVKVGEESNQLSLIFAKLSLQMEEELQHKAKMLGNTLEPLIILFLGALVAVILIAMYLPMFQISNSF